MYVGGDMSSGYGPNIIDGVTYAPIRPILDALNMRLEWDGSTNTITIIPKQIYEFNATIIANIEYKDGVLTIDSEDGWEAKHPSLSYPVADNCFWGSKYVGEFFCTEKLDADELIRRIKHGMSEKGSDFGIHVEIVDGYIVKVYTVSS